MQMFCNLPLFTILPRCVCCLPDVMMWTDEDKMIGIVEKSSDCLYLGLSRHLSGAEGVEADNDDGIDVRNQRLVELPFDTVVAHPFDLDHRVAGQCFGLLNKSREVRLLDVIEETTDTLIEMAAIRQSLELRVEKPTQFKYRWKAIVNDSEWRPGLCRAAPGEVEKDSTIGHP